MSHLTDESVRQLARLCCLSIEENEIPFLLTQLEKVLSYIDLLQKVEVSSLDPYSHMEIQGIGSLRDDTVHDLLPREDFLENAPDHVAGMIRVPPVLKNPT